MRVTSADAMATTGERLNVVAYGQDQESEVWQCEISRVAGLVWRKNGEPVHQRDVPGQVREAIRDLLAPVVEDARYIAAHLEDYARPSGGGDPVPEGWERAETESDQRMPVAFVKGEGEVVLRGGRHEFWSEMLCREDKE